ncbi:MAG TPA: cupin domain-containing protein [Solirubrobacteraceae bacterium]|nr:cupin domain-containing protein [Solirubrobacteraceae bacterium]
MISHWDDASWMTYEHGDLRCERQGLSRPRGSAGATLSRYRIPTGARSMPLHVHVDEEELFYVLAGSGLSWQGDATHEIGAGDLIVHLADAEPHTLIGTSDEPLEVLAYASGSPTQLTLLPRAGVAWVGSRWIPQDAPHPFQAEPVAGELPPVAPRPPTIVALDGIEPQLQDRGPVHRTRRDVARAAGSKLSGLQHVTVSPGRRSSVRHCHSHEDELFLVLGGSGTLLLGDECHEVGTGSIVARPAATGVAHCFEAGDEGLVMLAYGTRDPADMCWYPDSQKISFRGLHVIGRVEPLDYWDGEELLPADA